jgi:hypothetical protein
MHFKPHIDKNTEANMPTREFIRKITFVNNTHKDNRTHWAKKPYA